MRSRGGKVALAIGALALVAVGVPAFLGRREIEERWWLWRLEAGNAEAKKAAIAKLGEMRSLKALPEFEKVVDSGDRALVEAVLAALPSIGPEAAGVGFRALERAVEGTDSRWTDTVASTLPLLGLTEAVEKASCRPDARQAYGEALERKGRWEDALRQYLWCLDHGAYAPRSSWAINRLGRNSPGALMALRNLRDRLEEMALTSASRRGFLSSLFSRNPTSLVKNLADMNEALDEWDNTLQFFRKLKEIEGGREARRILFWRVLDRLLHDHAYQEIMEAEPELDAVLVDWIWRATNPIAKAWYAAADANQARNWSTSEHFLKRAVAKAGDGYQALLGAGRWEAAEHLACDLLDAAPILASYASLVRNAALAGRPKTASWLIEDAAKRLSEEEMAKLRGALERPTEPLEDESTTPRIRKAARPPAGPPSAPASPGSGG